MKEEKTDHIGLAKDDLKDAWDVDFGDNIRYLSVASSVAHALISIAESLKEFEEGNTELNTYVKLHHME